ncbi:MAG: cyclic nucleotide-binding domain-containing protein [Chitinivibrionales bacterium]|nr:cyclic nucleotide-binding domain-containing protein [Chitinivibrionales bacterium]
MAGIPGGTAAKVRFQKGELLFKQGDPSRDLYVIQQGSVRIFKTEGDVAVDLATVGAGEVVGEVAAIDGGVRSASVIAEEETEALVIAADNFVATLNGVPEWFQKIARILVQRLREVDEKIDNSMYGDKTRQVALLVAMMTDTGMCTPSESGRQLSLKFVENEIMDILGLNPSDVLELLTKLSGKELLILEKSKIVISDVTRLEQYGNTLFEKSESSPVT